MFYDENWEMYTVVRIYIHVYTCIYNFPPPIFSQSLLRVHVIFYSSHMFSMTMESKHMCLRLLLFIWLRPSLDTD